MKVTESKNKRLASRVKRMVAESKKRPANFFAGHKSEGMILCAFNCTGTQA
ncbi:hypothetical protein GCWU000342_01206 [Shuttleworthella satelles DSM 14600]|uniref:Uncharacterized protein n=1 Tax=Shuttleworthella satelles DSM 14600 TaxID=626523 RepID=C4GBA5_9FIRM|nr:hypothetical protein GCWU000342_01206 [Shuttleworthia satelles DSM 14600]